MNILLTIILSIILILSLSIYIFYINNKNKRQNCKWFKGKWYEKCPQQIQTLKIDLIQQRNLLILLKF